MPQQRRTDAAAALHWLAARLYWEQTLSELRDASRAGQALPKRDRPAA
ncbi:MAG TPA: hypothetical protein VIB48_11085 [Acidimicrobiia bacterium]|jgi:hypothetical protein